MIDMIDILGRTLHLERTYEAPQDHVFKAWSSSEAVSRWFGLDPLGLNPDPDAKTIAEVDFREGGVFVLNSGAYTVRGVYKEISPPNKISFTWLWDYDQEVPEMLVSIEFSPTKTGTKVTLIHDYIADNIADPIKDQELLKHNNYGWETTKSEENNYGK